MNDSWTLKLHGRTHQVVHPCRGVPWGGARGAADRPGDVNRLTRKEFVAEYGGTREDEVQKSTTRSTRAPMPPTWRTGARPNARETLRSKTSCARTSARPPRGWTTRTGVSEGRLVKDASCINCEARIDTEIDSPSNYEGQSWWTHTVEVKKFRGPATGGRGLSMENAARARRRRRSRRKFSPSSAATVLDGPTKVKRSTPSGIRSPSPRRCPPRAARSRRRAPG